MRRGAKKNAPQRRGYTVLVAPQGFEPRLAESESAVLPLNEGATICEGVAQQPRWLPDLSVRIAGAAVNHTHSYSTGNLAR